MKIEKMYKTIKRLISNEYIQFSTTKSKRTMSNENLSLNRVSYEALQQCENENEIYKNVY